ncbi:RNA 2'-phosphotransferase [Planosporangium flavigriseum]|uniref:Probable RNA 2'-phosphotransferase n=1 Tax=Planosporangium flavigriseum TaxID=373681 RepID=A0A8J3LF26_9ACTN|nr:RNA 2'-phosphotransferase [Planosporangium flavigriseum]NJC64610.1 RNA 2'-phosphotransferase [Planosporangium flavigriseum]GIG71907.1 putative RNA 2'-phosphotransferase [Planosporangium flavigriseum]
MDLVGLSKRLSYVLRHRPDSVGLTLDRNGWVAVDDLLAALAAHGVRVGRAELDTVLAGNDKRRFAVEAGPDGRDRIRASQGHSIPIDLGLTPVTPPPVLYHGTSAAAVPSIRAEGLRKARRHHVHLSGDLSTAQRVGARRRGPVEILTVDAAAMAADGHQFYRSANGVWLTDHVPPRYLR